MSDYTTPRPARVDAPTEMDAVVVVWTERGAMRRIISMRRMHQWEIKHVGLD